TLNKLIDSEFVKAKNDEYQKGRGSGSGDVAKNRIGAAYAGAECLRQLAYRYHKVKEDAPNEKYVTQAELKRHADYGFDTEKHIVDWLRYAGFEVLDKDEDGKQFGYKSAFDGKQYRFAGELDGIITKSPVKDIPDNINLECKKATVKKFDNFCKDGVKKSSTEYYSQMQIGMAYTQRSHCLFVMVCLDNMKVYYELVPFDLECAQKVNDRLVKVIESKYPENMPKLGYNEDDFRCMFCNYKTTCWELK
ncbi:MAG: hypothetical protein RSD17_07780, partial [Oscillospiraceae bacterium]